MEVFIMSSCDEHAFFLIGEAQLLLEELDATLAFLAEDPTILEVRTSAWFPMILEEQEK